MGKEVERIKDYFSAANYLSAIQIYLKGNYLLKEDLKINDIKEVLLGHWGTCPGINFVYSHLNNLIKKKNCSMMYIVGPGHGFPAIQANLFLEGTLEKYYPQATHSEKGIGYIAKQFSWPYGFPSHSNPGTPGVILEGGELGYALSTAYGAILDNPELIVTCLVGDGEAETGPTATAWHINKFINPKTNGAVLPILHVNGYKISGPTIFGRMSDKELKSLFYGYGYEPIIVQGNENVIHEKMIKALEHCYKKIQDMKKLKNVESPRFPMIILKTPKGWTGPKYYKGKKIEGNYASHQVPLKEVREDVEQLREVEDWFHSYNFNKLFSGKSFNKNIKDLIPKPNLRIGANKNANPDYKPLKLPNPKDFAEPVPQPGTIGSSSMRRAGAYLNEVMKLNKNNFRLMSPDETYSNKLDAVFETTNRAFVWPKEKWDENIANDGKVIEMLSEHTLQGLTQGYLLTGRHAVFASYEAFIDIVSSMMAQYEKFLRVATEEVKWRKPIPSFNYILTSSGWRQQHNGFSHQNPSFISGMLEKPGCYSRVYFPVDGSTTLEVLKTCLDSKNLINVIAAGKTVEPRWLTPAEARQAVKRGIMTWNFASDKNPDLIFCGIGDYTSKECLAAIQILKEEAPELKLRFVNIIELTEVGIGNNECIIPLNSNEYFTKDKPVIINYSGYTTDMESILLKQNNPERFMIHGYEESGSTTTPFDMHVRNKTDRYNLAIDALELLGKSINKSKAKKLISKYRKKLEDHKKYILENGVDPDEIKWWKWERNT